jgi:hypothetical protein
VRIIDATPPSEKLLYKRRLQIAEQHFYKFLVGG